VKTPSNANAVRHRAKLAALAAYIAENGWPISGALPTSWRGLNLHAYVKNCRAWRTRLPGPVVAALEDIPGWAWKDDGRRTAHKLAVLRQHVRQHGWTFDHRPDLVVDGVDLGAFVRTWRTPERRRRAPAWLREHLDGLRIALKDRRDRAFNLRLGQLNAIAARRMEEAAGSLPPDELARLAQWLYQLRRAPERVPAHIRAGVRRLMRPV